VEVESLTKDRAEKAAELARLKEELDECENARLDLSEQLGILTADKNVVDTDLKTSHAEAARHKKELEVFISILSLDSLYHSVLNFRYWWFGNASNL